MGVATNAFEIAHSQVATNVLETVEKSVAETVWSAVTKKVEETDYSAVVTSVIEALCSTVVIISLSMKMNRTKIVIHSLILMFHVWHSHLHEALERLWNYQIHVYYHQRIDQAFEILGTP